MLCHCGSLIPYISCCEPYLLKKEFPTTAEQLMRSRYTAFCRLDSEYLQDTVSGPAKQAFCSEITPHHWVGLEILKTSKGTAQDRVGSVEFKAYFMEHNKRQVLHEISQFKQIKGTWYYVGGDVLGPLLH